MIFQFLSAGNVQKYDEKSFDELFNAVSKYYSKEELQKIIEKSLESDEITEKSLAFIYSPLTLKKQAESQDGYQVSGNSRGSRSSAVSRIQAAACCAHSSVRRRADCLE